VPGSKYIAGMEVVGKKLPVRYKIIKGERKLGGGKKEE
jgi:hypothetical protein